MRECTAFVTTCVLNTIELLEPAMPEAVATFEYDAPSTPVYEIKSPTETFTRAAAATSQVAVTFEYPPCCQMDCAAKKSYGRAPKASSNAF